MQNDRVKMTDLVEQAVELADAATCDLREVSFELEAACKMVGLEIIHRWDEDREKPVPYLVLEQLRGRMAEPLMQIEYDGELWRVTSIDLPPEFDGINSYTIPEDHTPRWLSVVRADQIIDDLPH
jgi:hypothetical protein